ncbi:MAG: TolC family protein [Pseudomonadota bacterium]
MIKFLFPLGMATLFVGNLFSLANAADLNDIYHFTQRKDPQLRASQSHYLASCDGVKEGYSYVKPRVDLVGTWGLVDQNTHGDNTILYTTNDRYFYQDYALTVRQSIFNMNNYLRIKQLNNWSGRSRLQTKVVEQDIRMHTAEVYFNVLSLLDILQIQKKEIDLYEILYKKAKEDYENDKDYTHQINVNQGRSMLDQALIYQNALIKDLGFALTSLEVMTGETITALNPVDKNALLPTLVPNVSSSWVQQGLSNNMAIRLADTELVDAAYEYRKARAEAYPTVDLWARSGYSDYSGGAMGAYNQINSGVYLTLSIPLYQGGRVSARKSQALNLEQEKRHLMDGLRDDVVRKINDSFITMQTASQTYTTLNKSSSEYLAVNDVSDLAMSLGLVNLIDAQNVFRNQFMAEKQRLQSFYLYIIETLRVRHLAGVLTEEQLTDMNRTLLDPTRTMAIPQEYIVPGSQIEQPNYQSRGFPTNRPITVNVTNTVSAVTPASISTENGQTQETSPTVKKRGFFGKMTGIFKKKPKN